jgi:hypothetical protein
MSTDREWAESVCRKTDSGGIQIQIEPGTAYVLSPGQAAAMSERLDQLVMAGPSKLAPWVEVPSVTVQQATVTESADTPIAIGPDDDDDDDDEDTAIHEPDKMKKAYFEAVSQTWDK